MFLVDKSSKYASGASGNKLALQMPKLTLDNSPYGLLSLEALLIQEILQKILIQFLRLMGLLFYLQGKRSS